MTGEAATERSVSHSGNCGRGTRGIGKNSKGTSNVSPVVSAIPVAAGRLNPITTVFRRSPESGPESRVLLNTQATRRGEMRQGSSTKPKNADTKKDT
jgi:hypothetical protein